MLTTETEAMEKACVDRNQGPCLGSACMAWRWECWRDGGGSLAYVIPSGELVDEDHFQRLGYCGKAGAPTRGEL